MDDRTALLLAWLEGEGERQRRPILPPPQAKDPALRGWVQVGVCALAVTLAAALFVCWLGTGWQRAMWVSLEEEQRREYFQREAGDPNRPVLPVRWWRGGGDPALLPWLDYQFVRLLFWGVGVPAGVLAASLLVYWLTAAQAGRSGWPPRNRIG
jgi:hypothetical protein